MARSRNIVRLAWLLVVAGAVASLPIALTGKSKPTIVITVVPPSDAAGGPDKEGLIKGKASGLDDCKDCRVVLFARTNQWYVQPLVDSPYTAIHDGAWQSETHLGTQYAALLVRGAYKPLEIVQRLPDVGGDVLAIDIKPGK